MKVVGIIAEYDPFHNGHALQLKQARELGAQKIIVCLSTAITQRGALPLLPEQVRIKAALNAGADIIISLPAPFACTGAERFARAGVYLLTAMGCDTLVFGAETPEKGALLKIAECLISDEYKNELKKALSNGAKHFAAARMQAVQQCTGDNALAEMLAQPNNNLAVEYCKAMLEQQSDMRPFALPRRGAGHGEALSDKMFASGTALRELWETKGVEAIKSYVPPYAFELYKKAYVQGAFTDREKENIALLSRLRLFSQQGFANVRGISEGLEHRLDDLLKTATSIEQLYDALTTVRYPRARMRRLCWDAAMGGNAMQNFDKDNFESLNKKYLREQAEKEQAEKNGIECIARHCKTIKQRNLLLPALPTYIHVLGAKKEALFLLKNTKLPAAVSLAKLEEQTAESENVVRAHTLAVDFATLCHSKSGVMSTAYTQKPVILAKDTI